MHASKRFVYLGITALAAGTILTACGTGPKTETSLKPEEFKQLVSEFSSGNRTAESASITDSKLTVQDKSGKETVYTLPEQEFFVSIAPYLDQTHPCATHNLAGCQGELKEKPFTVTVRDSSGKAVMEKESIMSQANGFMDLWLPRKDTYSVTVSYEGRSAESKVSTYEGDNTCITTMHLS